MPEPASRHPFTDREIKRFLRYLAEYSPYDEKRGGNLIFQQLETFSKEKEEYRWARTHPWGGWKNKYRDNEREYDRAIKTLVKKMEEEGKISPTGGVKKETRRIGKPSNSRLAFSTQPREKENGSASRAVEPPPHARFTKQVYLSKPLVHSNPPEVSNPGQSLPVKPVPKLNSPRKRKVGAEDEDADFDPVKVNNGPDPKRQKTKIEQGNAISNGKNEERRHDAGADPNTDVDAGEGFADMDQQQRPKDNLFPAVDLDDPKVMGRLQSLGFSSKSDLLRFIAGEVDPSKRAMAGGAGSLAKTSYQTSEQKTKPTEAVSTPNSVGNGCEKSNLYPTILDEDRVNILVPASTPANEEAVSMNVDSNVLAEEPMGEGVDPTSTARPLDSSPAAPPMSSLKEPESSSSAEGESASSDEEQKDELVSEPVLEVRQMGGPVKSAVPKTLSKSDKGKGKAVEDDDDEDDFFGSPPPDSSAPDGDATIAAPYLGQKPPTQSPTSTNATTKAGPTRSLPKHQEGAFHSVLGTSSARKTVNGQSNQPKARKFSTDSSSIGEGSYSESEVSDIEPRSDVADIGVPDNLRAKAKVEEKAAAEKEKEKTSLVKSPSRPPYWPPQRQSSANRAKENMPPPSSLAMNSDITFYASQVPTSTPKVVQPKPVQEIKKSLIGIPLLVSKASASSEKVAKNPMPVAQPSPVVPKQFLAPKPAPSASQAKASAPPVVIATAVPTDVGRYVLPATRDATPSTTSDSVPNHNPFLTDELAKRLRKGAKGKEKEVAGPPSEALPFVIASAERTERRRSVPAISKTSSGPPLDLRKRVLGGMKNGQSRPGEAKKSPNLRRVASAPNDFVQPQSSSALILPGPQNAFTSTFTFVHTPPSSSPGLLSPADLSQDLLTPTALSRISPDDSYHFLRAGVLSIFRTMAAKHDQTEKRVREVYEQCGDLKETDHLLAKLNNMMQEEIARVGEKRRSGSAQTTLTASGSGSSDSSMESLETHENELGICSIAQPKELDLADISRRSSLATNDRKRPRNSLNFTPADQDPQYERIVSNAYAPLSARSQKYVRHVRHSLTSPNKSQDRSRRESGLHTVINLDDDSLMEIDADTNAQGNKTGDEKKQDMESFDSAKEEDEVLLSLTPAPQRVSKDTEKNQVGQDTAPTFLKSVNSLEVSKNNAVGRNIPSPTPTRTSKQAQLMKPPSKPEKMKHLAVDAIPTQQKTRKDTETEKRQTCPKKPKFKQRPLPPAFTPDEDEFLRKNESGPEYNRILKRHGERAVKMRQTELNELDMVESD